MHSSHVSFSCNGNGDLVRCELPSGRQIRERAPRAARCQGDVLAWQESVTGDTTVAQLKGRITSEALRLCAAR